MFKIKALSYKKVGKIKNVNVYSQRFQLKIQDKR